MTSGLLALGLLLASQNPGAGTASLSGRVLDGDTRRLSVRRSLRAS